MKKFFTLVSVALAAMSLNAQVEKYTAITYSEETAADGSITKVMTLSDEFKAAVTDAEGNVGSVATNVTAEGSVVNFGTANVTVKAVGGSTPADVPDDPTDADGDGKADNTEDTHVDINSDGTVNSWKPIEWKQKNQGDIKYAWVEGTGNPAAEIKADTLVSDGFPATYWVDGKEYTKFKPAYTYYNPDGSLGVPVMGVHYQFTAKVAGTIKVAVWINKGNRDLFIVDGTTTLPIASYTAEGYIEGQNVRVPNEATEDLTDSIDQKKWLSYEEIDSIHKAAKVNADGVDTKPYVLGNGNKFWGNIIFEMEAGKTYYVFNPSSQIGFQGYEFTPAEGGSTSDSNQLLVKNDAGLIVAKTQAELTGNEFDKGGYWYMPAGTVFYEDNDIKISAAVMSTIWPSSWTGYPNAANYFTEFGTDAFINIGDNGVCGSAEKMAETEIWDPAVLVKSNQSTLLIEAKKSGTYSAFVQHSKGNRYIGMYQIYTDAEMEATEKPGKFIATKGQVSMGADGATTGDAELWSCDLEAGKSYYLIGGSDNILCYYQKYTAGADGIESVKVVKELDVNAPIYNLAGQRVTANFKGIVLQNGQKYILR